jgi:hypothetical protein
MQSKVASYFCLHQPNEHHFSERNYEVLHIPILVHVKRAAIFGDSIHQYSKSIWKSI